MSNLSVIKKQLDNPAVLGEFKKCLPAHIKPETFARIAFTAIQNSYGLDQCDPQSVLKSLSKCAGDGLLPDGREAAIVKYKNQAQYLPMVQGVIKKMLNSGMISDVNAHVVYTGDEFDAAIYDGVWRVTHKPNLFGDRGEFMAVYAVAVYKDGSKHVEVMSKAEIEKVRGKSQNGGKTTRNGGLTVWEEWFDEMAKKSVIHRLAKRVPCSADFYEFSNQDQTRDFEQETQPQEKKKSIIEGINEGIIDAEYTEQPRPDSQEDSGADDASEDLSGVGESMER